VDWATIRAKEQQEIDKEKGRNTPYRSQMGELKPIVRFFSLSFFLSLNLFLSFFIPHSCFLEHDANTHRFLSDIFLR
jgi:hypothetical protein